MTQPQRKRDRFKNAITSTGKKIAKFRKSRVGSTFIPLFGLIIIGIPLIDRWLYLFVTDPINVPTKN